MPESEKKLPDEFSKTRRKQDMLALQDIGKKLMDLPLFQLAKIQLPDILREAILHGHTLKAHEAKRRHLQYIGKLMREVDIEIIMRELAIVQASSAQKKTEFHEQEKWRDKLIAEGDEGLQALMVVYPEADRQYLRQLIRKAQADKAKEVNTGAAKELFRYLHLLSESKSAE